MDKSVLEWLRHIQIEWALKSDQLARVLHVNQGELEKNLEHSQIQSTESTLPLGLETAAPLIGIYRKLAARFPKTEDQVKWLFTGHQDFGGSKPIDVAASSVENLYWVAYFLESQYAAKSAE